MSDTAKRPPPAELWRQAAGDRDKYIALMLEHGWLVKREPGEPAKNELPCGWSLKSITES